MNNEHAVESAGNSDLRAKIDEAKRHHLPLPDLMQRLGLGAHAKKSARCPFADHEDKHPSFSVFQGEDGFWHYKCFSLCGEGDEILFLSKLKGLSLTKAITLYLDMAGFPSSRPLGSHECPASREYGKSHESHVLPQSHGSPESPMYPVSNGQRPVEALNVFAARNACTEHNTARERRWQLVRDLRALEEGIGRELNIGELMVAFDEWHRLSQTFLDPAKTREDYLAAFLAERAKVRVPTGEGALTTALDRVSKLSLDQLPLIPGYANAPESWRRIAALHRELSRRSKKKDKRHFLSYRDAAKVFPGLTPQKAHPITLALAAPALGVIEIISKGKAGPNGKAAEFRYLLSDTDECPGDDDDEIPV